MIKRWLLTLLVLAAVMVPGRSFALLGLVSVEGAVGGFMPTPSGHLQYDGGGNTNADVDSQLGFDDEAFVPHAFAWSFPWCFPMSIS